MLNDFELSGPMPFMTEAIREHLHGRYDKAAYACLSTFGLLTYKAYKKDKQRIF